MIICKFIIDFLVMLKKNQQLIATIKHILEVFPEAVIIRGLPEDSLNKEEFFVNFAAKEEILEDVCQVDARDFMI